MSNPANDTPAGEGRFDRAIGWVSDRLNPILVKETRQALKSRQFTLWFVLLIVACWITTIGGVAIIGPSIYYVSAGGYLLYAYFLILALPLVVVVPFSAYRSLSSEQEDNTRDLLEVSRLTPRQIINGKLGSAVLQAAIYLSALAPCIAFTYLLRGVDVLHLFLLLAYAVLASVGLSTVGLLVAASTRQKYAQVVMSVVLAGGLFTAFSSLLGAAMAVIGLDANQLRREDFGWAHLAIFSLYATTLAIVYLAAAAMTTFASANRSTALRVALVAQQTVYVAWVAGVAMSIPGRGLTEMMVWAFLWAAVYWFIAGAVMTGESPVLSQRVRRSLPQSLLGRALFTWFNPGAGSGYVFAVANLAMLAVLAIVAGMYLSPTATQNTDGAWGIALLWAYVAAYLGLGRLVTLGLQRLTEVSTLGCFLIQVLLLLGGSGAPYLLQSLSDRWRNIENSLLQMPSPYWAVTQLLDGRMSQQQRLSLVVTVGCGALILLSVNLVLAAREAHQVRLAKPKRIVEDDLEQNPPPEAKPTSPWGDAVGSAETRVE